MPNDKLPDVKHSTNVIQQLYKSKFFVFAATTVFSHMSTTHGSTRQVIHSTSIESLEVKQSTSTYHLRSITFKYLEPNEIDVNLLISNTNLNRLYNCFLSLKLLNAVFNETTLNKRI